ncbi:hypothetical protein BROUX41_001446 [Berkeleyomyces rouxiae]|uniref:uncharacterized protein n=1 Tax=Berkeleyomyces rouxiae TaxID=2035830 RepID=UPI003B771F01
MAPRKSIETTIRTVAADADQASPSPSPSPKKSNSKSSKSAGAEDSDEARNGHVVANGDAASVEGDGAEINGKSKDSDEGKDVDAITIEDLTLPKSIMTRLAKADLPTGTQIQGNAMTAITRSATVFINHLASAANDNTKNAGKKTILPADVFKALDDTEFDFMRQQLELEFAKYTELQAAKRSKKKPVGGKRDTSDAGAGTAGAAADSDEEAEGPRSKKAKIDASAMEVDGEEPGEEEEEDPQEEEEEEEEQVEEEEEEEASDDAADEVGDDVDEDPELIEERMQRELLSQNEDNDDDESD